jgi:hypothetical protein
MTEGEEEEPTSGYVCPRCGGISAGRMDDREQYCRYCDCFEDEGELAVGLRPRYYTLNGREPRPCSGSAAWLKWNTQT